MKNRFLEIDYKKFPFFPRNRFKAFIIDCPSLLSYPFVIVFNKKWILLLNIVL